MPKVYKVKVYRTKYSRIVRYELDVEGQTRTDAFCLLRRLAGRANGAARDAAEAAVSGACRYSMIRNPYPSAYAATDGSWRGWSTEDWKHDPPAAYAIWDRASA